MPHFVCLTLGGGTPIPRAVTTRREISEDELELVKGLAGKLRNELGLASETEDLVAAGYQGLVEAHARFDATRGVQFTTFAYYRIRGAMIDYVRKSANLSRRAYEKVRLAESADRVGEGVAEMRAADPAARADTAATVAAIDDGLAKLTMGFALAYAEQSEPEPSPEEALIEKDVALRLRHAVAGLDEKERALLEGHYFDGRRFDEVAAELGISKSWASRVHAKALEKLKASLG
jgi:RNA polymerase sigma factor for flagellar operon FliA